MEPMSDRMARLVGERYANCGFTNFEVGNDKDTESRKRALETVRRYAIEIEEHRRAGTNLVLIGGCGTGKDHLTTAVLRHAIQLGMVVAFTRGSTLAEKMIQAASGGDRLDERFVQCDLLAISDFEPKGKETASATVLAGYLELIDERYRRMRPTIVSSNILDRVSMSKAVGMRVVDRLLDGGIVVRMEWESARKRRA
jgi:DNA replication protein DnaC